MPNPVIRLDFQYGSGVIVKEKMSEDYLLVTGIPLLDQDEVLDRLEERIADLFDPCYSPETQTIDREKLAMHKKELLSLVGKVKERILVLLPDAVLDDQATSLLTSLPERKNAVRG